ncbi:MAG: cell surface protein [Candidatus Saccharimonadaceae bacterium]
MKKIIFLIASIIFLSACSNDDVVKEERDQLKTEQLEQQLQLKNAADKKLIAISLEDAANMYEITFRDDSKVKIPNSASLIMIGENGNWWIDGKNTAEPSKDENGDERKVTISKMGVWQISGKETGISLRGPALKNETEIISITLQNKMMVFTFANKLTINLETTIPEADMTSPSQSIEVDKMKWLLISIEVNEGEEPTFTWTLNNEVISTSKELLHVFGIAGIYNIELIEKNNALVITKNIKVIVNEQTYENNVAKVFEFLPAPGQFVNKMPVATAEDNVESMRKKAEDALKEGSMISLGGYGGSVIMGFDHTIVNKEGKDFLVLGNASENSAEPGVIMVSYDANGNGLADDEWYEIEGSQHQKENTIKNYEITYYKTEKEPTNPKEPNYIRWTDNQNNTGYIAKNEAHRQTYYPLWKGMSITLKGTLLEANIQDTSGDGSYWVSPAYEFGYADNWANNDEKAKIDLDWAVDKDGEKVKLKGIDFVKVYTANRAQGGDIGEVSTEVAGLNDLSLQ